jgi:hypothetical protein
VQRFAIGVFVTALMSVGSIASAEPVTFRFDGVIDSVGANLGSGLQAGDHWSLSIQWNSGPQVDGGGCAGPGSSTFCDQAGGSGNLGGMNFGIFGQFNIASRPDYIRFDIQDHLGGFTGPRLGDSQQFEPTFAEFAWRWATPPSNPESPYPPAEMPDGVSGALTLYYIQFAPGEEEIQRQLVRGHITSVSKVPTPSTLLLTAMGLGGLFGLRRKYRS